MVYEAPEGQSTVMSFNLVCSRAGLTRMQDALYFIGSALGYFLWLPTGDIFGRKPMIFTGMMMYVFTDLLTAVATSSPIILTLRFISGMAYAVVTGLSGVLLYEINPPQVRIIVAIVGQLASTNSQMALALTSYAFPKWRYWVLFEAGMALVVGLAVLAIDESVRWLLIMYRADPDLNMEEEEKARKIVKRLVERRLNAKKKPANAYELAIIKDELAHRGTLEIGTFSTLDFKEHYHYPSTASIKIRNSE